MRECFDIINQKSLNLKIKRYISLRFRLYQHERDRNLIELLIKYLGAGKIEKDPRNSVVSLIVTKFSDVNNIIIPFFEKYPLHGVKLLDFLD